MKARFSTTTLLFLCFTGLMAWYFVYEKDLKVKKTAQEETSKKLIQLSKDDIQEIGITHGEDSSFQLKRSGTDWILTAPVEDLADSGVINSLLTSLTSSEKERVVEDEPKSLELFGLEKPNLTIRVSKDQTFSEEIFLGNQTQVGFSVYAKASSGKEVFKTNRSLLTSFQKSLFELRNKNLVTLKKGEIKEVEIVNSSGQILVSRNSEDKWILGREASAVDSAEWGKVLNTITDLKAIGIASEKSELAAFRLDKPLVKVWLSEGTDKAKLGLFVSESKEKVFAKRDDKPLIYELDKGVLKELSKSATNLKDLHLIAFNRFSVSRIRVSQGTVSFEFIKEGPVWTLKDSKSDRQLDANKVETFLTLLQDSKATRFSASTPKGAPTLTIELFEKKADAEFNVAKLVLTDQKTGDPLGTSNHLKEPWAISRELFKQINVGQEYFF